MRATLDELPIDPGRLARAAVAAVAGLGLGVAMAGCEVLGGSGADGDGQRTRTVTVEISDGSRAGDRSGDGRPEAAAGEPPQVPGDESCDGAREPITEDNLRQSEITLRCLTNAVRQREGLAELRFSEQLARAAATRSNDMAEANFFGHDGPDGQTVRSAVRGTGWIPDGKSWLLGENIAWAPEGGATPAQIMRSWLDSPTHRENILNEHFTQVGHGAVAAVPKAGAEPGATVTAIFGATGRAAREAQTG